MRALFNERETSKSGKLLMVRFSLVVTADKIKVSPESAEKGIGFTDYV
jgi:hypothetical protein